MFCELALPENEASPTLKCPQKAIPHQAVSIAKCSATKQALPNMIDAEVGKSEVAKEVGGRKYVGKRCPLLLLLTKGKMRDESQGRSSKALHLKEVVIHGHVKGRERVGDEEPSPEEGVTAVSVQVHATSVMVWLVVVLETLNKTRLTLPMIRGNF
ncbi:hypothetical protein Tco_0506346 [Tanacetum coccineum]